MRSNNISLISLLLVVVGEILIVFSFLVLVPPPERGPVFYLDIAVATAIYAVIISRFFNLWVDKEDFESKIAGLGILWICVWLYTLVAISGIVYGLNGPVPFKIQLLYQTVFIFLFVAGSFLAQSSASFAVSVAADDQQQKEGVRSLAASILSVEIAYHAKNLNWDEEQQLIAKVKEKVRFLSASNNANAKQLESDFVNEAKDVLYAIGAQNPDQQLIKTKLNNCDNLLNQRKQFFIN